MRTGMAGAPSKPAAICLRVGGDLLQRFRTIEMLAAGDEPNFKRF